MLCKKCGNELKMGAKFCYSCGYYVDEEDEDIEGSDKKKKKKNGEPKLSFKERREKRKEEKRLAKEAKIRQKEIEAEEKEREKMAAEYEKEQKIKEFYKKENENKLRAERKAKAFEEKEKAKELERQKAIDDNFNAQKSKFDEELKQKTFGDNFNVNKNKFDEELKHKVNFSQKNVDDENANFSCGTEDLITRSPGLGIEESEASHHVKQDAELSFDDFKVENRYKKIENEIKSTSATKKSNLNLSYDEYKPSNKKKKGKSELSKYAVVILSSIVSFVVIFFLVYNITNKLNSNKEPEEPAIVEDITVLLSNCTLTIPGDLNYNVDGNTLYVAYDTHTLSFSVSKDNYDSYSADLTKLSKDFERRKYTVSSSDKREVDGKEFLVYKLLINGSSKYFYLTKVNASNVAMGMIELNGANSVEVALQSISNMISTLSM